MLYIIALFIPPAGTLLAGRIIATVLIAVLWVPSLLLGGAGHFVAVVLAWVIIASAKGDRRHRELLRALKKDRE